MNDKGLVERLRGRSWQVLCEIRGLVDDTTAYEAADTIEALQSRIEALEAALRNPPRHKWWSAGEPDCPPELKAPNGELWRMQCKVCGNGTGDGIICQGGLQQILKGSGNG
jgi:hypothetical protein